MPVMSMNGCVTLPARSCFRAAQTIAGLGKLDNIAWQFGLQGQFDVAKWGTTCY